MLIFPARRHHPAVPPALDLKADSPDLVEQLRAFSREGGIVAIDAAPAPRGEPPPADLPPALEDVADSILGLLQAEGAVKARFAR